MGTIDRLNTDKQKNYENYGYRENGDIVILDLGYIYPKRGNEQALSCPPIDYYLELLGYTPSND